ncbi:unnamed protein product [Eruca vesicaria subsp. sativa]|uniref:MATH domain-containing protein n=1 Tax=Eruca vesicaria subsp. sativa TaxID=29727 RepID=A0ABC8LES8_ERUVS|nr:unnamed protein product [Eruca vesicaria subsp. sativa]
MVRTLREERPSSKILTIESFSVIKERSEPYESSVFEASGYKWRLILYVTGNKTDGGNNHISLYVRIEDTNSLPKGWEVNVDLKLFVYNKKHNKYLTVTDGTVKRYNDANKEWGFRQLITLATLYNTNAGYMMQDTCSFGAEIFIVKPALQQEKVTFISNPPNRVERMPGVNNIILFTDLKDASKGYLVNDAIIFEAEMVKVSVTNVISA